MTQSEEREAQAKSEQQAGQMADLFAQMRGMRIETGDSGVVNIGGGLPSFIEQTAIAQGGGTVAVTHEPFELRVRTGEDGVAYLDIYDPRGTYEVFTSGERRETRNSVIGGGAAEWPDVGDKWHQIGSMAELTPNGGRVYVYVQPGETMYITAEAGRETEGDETCVGYADAQGASNTFTGAYAYTYEWGGGEGLFVDNNGMLTTDLDSITWDADTICYICRLYDHVFSFGDNIRSRSYSEIPVDESGKQVFVSKLPCRSHAADHADNFYPFREA